MMTLKSWDSSTGNSRILGHGRRFTSHYVLCLRQHLCVQQNDDGLPKDPDEKEAFREMNEYVDAVRQVERSKNLPPTLSAVLSDRAGQDLAHAMQLYTDDGKHGYYSNILEKHSQRWGGGNEVFSTLVSACPFSNEKSREPSDTLREYGPTT